MKRYLGVCLIVGLLLSLVVLPVVAQSDGECAYIETRSLNGGLRYSLFGAGQVEQLAVSGDELAALRFTAVDGTNACAGQQSTFLVADSSAATVPPQYHITINGSLVTFTGQISFGINPAHHSLSISVLQGFASVNIAAQKALGIPVGYSMYAYIDQNGATAGYWNGQTRMLASTSMALSEAGSQSTEVVIKVPPTEEPPAAGATDTPPSKGNSHDGLLTVDASPSADSVAPCVAAGNCPLGANQAGPQTSGTSPCQGDGCRTNPSNDWYIQPLDPLLQSNPPVIQVNPQVIPINPLLQGSPLIIPGINQTTGN